ncbi:MAG: hypothetical protein IJ087_01440 [Eggerthellaceae bacterium]|nr:hypothetical protein [Eggerthellaceae bacterium]
MIDFNYTAPELLPLRIQEVIDAPNEPHRIGGVVYVPEGGGECEIIQGKKGPKCSKCGKELPEDPYSDYEGNFCPTCGAWIRRAVEHG